MELLSTYVQNHLHSRRGYFLQQENGIVVGSPLSSVPSNIFIENGIRKYHHAPNVCLRYVDVTFFVWSHNQDALSEFLQLFYYDKTDLICFKELLF